MILTASSLINPRLHGVEGATLCWLFVGYNLRGQCPKEIVHANIICRWWVKRLVPPQKSGLWDELISLLRKDLSTMMPNKSIMPHFKLYAGAADFMAYVRHFCQWWLYTMRTTWCCATSSLPAEMWRRWCGSNNLDQTTSPPSPTYHMSSWRIMPYMIRSIKGLIASSR